MNFLRKSIFASAVIAMLSACSSDEPLNGGEGGSGQESGEGAYVGLTIEMPGNKGSRSTTGGNGGSSEGTEVGKDPENKVNDVIVVLATKTNEFITSVSITTVKAVPGKNSYQATGKVDKTRLNTYYQRTTDREVNVFVFCNPTSAMQSSLEKCELGNTDWAKVATTVITDGEASNIANYDNSRFLMANYSKATRQLPMTISDWSSFDSVDKAFNLSDKNNEGQANEIDNGEGNGRGAVEVERAAARFDFKDGSELGNNTYNVVMDAEDATKTLIQIQLNKMALVNLSKNFYDLRRVSADGFNDNAEICGIEKGGTNANYVVGPNASDFNNAINNRFGYSYDETEGKESYNFSFDSYFFNPLFDNSGRMDYEKFMATPGNEDHQLISAILGDDKLSDNYGEKSYKIWHYAGENVIPPTPSKQQYGISTGVVFKGKMIATEALRTTNESLYKAINNVENTITGTPSTDPILYSFGGDLYLTWTEVQKDAIRKSVKMVNDVPVKGENATDQDSKLSVDRSSMFYKAVFGEGTIGVFTWGTETYYDVDKSSIDIPAGEEAYFDEKGRDKRSANYAWCQWNDANKNDETLLGAMRKAVTGAGFTIYQTSKDKSYETEANPAGAGYYCYYFYWNRHNDNGDSAVMGPMEFAVVRNNVYKLAVTKINRLGHPRIPENDPDKPKPDEPDESNDIHMTVTCEVLPWVVRVNDIVLE